MGGRAERGSLGKRRCSSCCRGGGYDFISSSPVLADLLCLDVPERQGYQPPSQRLLTMRHDQDFDCPGSGCGVRKCRSQDPINSFVYFQRLYMTVAGVRCSLQPMLLFLPAGDSCGRFCVQWETQAFSDRGSD